MQRHEPHTPEDHLVHEAGDLNENRQGLLCSSVERHVSYPFHCLCTCADAKENKL